MAFVAGLSWTTRFELAWTSHFQSYFCPGEKSDASSCLSGRTKIEHAAGFFERTVQAAQETSGERPTVFQLACAAQSYDVVSYLLRVGLGPNSGPAYAHPIIQARRRGDTELEQILRNRLHIPKDICTRALWSLFNPHLVQRILWYSDTVTHQRQNQQSCLLPTSQAVKILLESGADTCSLVDYRGQRLPMIHALVYTLHDAIISREYRLEIFTILVKGGAKVDALGEARGEKTTISTLALAAALGELEMLNILLNSGVRRFWPRSSDIFHRLSEGTDSLNFEAVVCTLARKNLLWPDMRTGDGSQIFHGSHGPSLSAGDSVFASLRREYALGVISTTVSEQVSDTQGAIYSTRRLPKDYPALSPSASDSGNNAVDTAIATFTRVSSELVFELHAIPRYAHNDRLSKEMINFVRRRNYDHAFQSLLDGADLAVTFLPELGGPLPHIVDFLWHVWRTNMYLFFLAVQRLAFVTGASWILELRDAFHRNAPQSSPHSFTNSESSVKKRKPKESRLECAWRLIVRSGVFTSNRRRAEKTSSSRPALYYACAAENESVAKYLLYIGQRLIKEEDAAFALSRVASITQLLMAECTFAPAILSSAMELIFREYVPTYRSPLVKQPTCDRSKSQQSKCLLIVDTLLSNGVDVSMSVPRENKGVPLLHAAIYTDELLRLSMTKLVLQGGASLDSVGFVPWHGSSSTTRVSALALAALIPLPDIMDLLVGKGAAWIWSNDSVLQRLAEKNFNAFYAGLILASTASSSENK